MCDFQSSGASATTTTLTLMLSTPVSACGTASSSSWGVYSMSACWWNSSNGKNTRGPSRRHLLRTDAGRAGNRCNHPQWLALTDNSPGICLCFPLAGVIIDSSLYACFLLAPLFSLSFSVMPGGNLAKQNKKERSNMNNEFGLLLISILPQINGGSHCVVYLHCVCRRRGERHNQK